MLSLPQARYAETISQHKPFNTFYQHFFWFYMVHNFESFICVGLRSFIFRYTLGKLLVSMMRPNLCGIQLNSTQSQYFPAQMQHNLLLVSG